MSLEKSSGFPKMPRLAQKTMSDKDHQPGKHRPEHGNRHHECEGSSGKKDVKHGGERNTDGGKHKR